MDTGLYVGSRSARSRSAGGRRAGRRHCGSVSSARYATWCGGTQRGLEEGSELLLREQEELGLPPVQVIAKEDQPPEHLRELLRQGGTGSVRVAPECCHAGQEIVRSRHSDLQVVQPEGTVTNPQEERPIQDGDVEEHGFLEMPGAEAVHPGQCCSSCCPACPSKDLPPDGSLHSWSRLEATPARGIQGRGAGREPRRADTSTGFAEVLALSFVLARGAREAGLRRPPRLRRRALRAVRGAEPAELCEAVDRLGSLRALPARKLRDELQGLGISTRGCVDRESLLALLDSQAARLALESKPTSLWGAPPPEEKEAHGGSELLTESLEKAKRIEHLRGLGARELRRELGALGLSTRGCIDRESLLEVLESPAAVQALLGDRQPATSGSKERKKRGGAARGFGSPRGEEGAGATPAAPGQKLQGPEAAASQAAAPPASPKEGSTRIPIYVTTGVDQYGLGATSGRVICLDINLSFGSSPGRFVLDSVTHYSMIKASVAQNLSARDVGIPEWARGSGSASYEVRQVNLGPAWLGNLACGNLQLASVAGELPIPAGTCGILGLDFLRLFDWDIDVVRESAEVSTAPFAGGPVPFDVDGMRVVPLMKVRLPTGIDLLACPVTLQHAGRGDAAVDCMGIADLAVARSICNQAALDHLGVAVKCTDDASEGTVPDGPGVAEVAMQFAIGTGPDGPAHVQATAAVGNLEVFESMGLASTFPAVILGPDVLCCSRLIISTRLNSIWLPS